MNLGTRHSHPEGPAIVSNQHSRFRLFAKISLLALAMAALALPACAQQQKSRIHHETNANRRARIQRQIEETYSHSWEVAGGGGYLRFRPGENLQKNNEVNFWADVTRYLSPKLGITGEIRGAYGRAKVGNTNFNIANPQISEYPYMGGVTYRFYRKEKYAVSAFALGGAAIGKFDSGTKDIPATLVGLWPTTNARPAFSVGFNLDTNIYTNLVFRISPNYMGTAFGSSSVQNNIGVNIGIAYRFGKQK